MTISESTPLFSKDELMSDAAPADVVLERAKADLSVLETMLADLERSLARLEEGTYGRCEVCDAEIDAQRLTEQPALRHCDVHEPHAAEAGA